MSYQLIYTSAQRLLSPGLSGYGIVARSVGMPRQLVERLTELCRGHEDEPEALSNPLYTYRLVPCRGEEYHVLSCVQDAGPDYSGRRCHIAHHLALTADEALALRRNAARPTPAGLTFALQQGGFWLARWEGEARLLEGEPKLTAAALPDASQQQTWKDLTGHKGNARCFYTPPYDGDCLITLPAETSAVRCLLLLHESDWLAADRGWGHSFCTPGSTDTTGIRRICTLPTAKQPSRPLRGNRAPLTISHELELPPPPEPAPQPGSPQPRHLLPYHYAESPDEELYATPTKHRPIKRNIAYLAALFLIGAGMYFGASDQADELGSVARDTMRHFSDKENLDELRNLLAAPYSAEATPARLEQLRTRIATSESGDGSAALKRCVDTLCLAGSSAESLASTPAELEACAQALGLPQGELLHLALLLATQDQNVEGWQQRLTPEARAAWGSTLADSPLAQAWLAEARLAAFVRALIPATETPPAPTTVTPTVEMPPVAAPLRPRSTAHPGTITALAGQAAPPPLLHALERAPLVLEQGEFIRCRIPGGKPAPAQRMELAPEGNKLHLSPGNRAGEYTLRPDAATGESWELHLRVQDGVIVSVTEEGMPVALKLPLSDRAQQAYEVLLLPHWELVLEPTRSPEPPPPPTEALKFRESDLVIQHAPRSTERPRLMLGREKAMLFPWVPMEAAIDLKQDHFHLPPLNAANQLHPPAQPADLPYQAELSLAEDGSCSICLRRRYDFSHALHRKFLRVANEPCGGAVENGAAPDSTLAHAYALSLDMENRRTRQEAIGQYIALFNDPEFAAFMQQVLQKTPQCLPTPTSDHETPEQARSRVTSAMASAATRKEMRLRLRIAITKALVLCYQEESWAREAQAGTGMKLVLSRVELLPNGSLAWQFKLEPTPTHGTPQD